MKRHNNIVVVIPLNTWSFCAGPITPDSAMCPMLTTTIEALGLFCQQAGLSLDETPRISVDYASVFSGNANPTQPNSLPDENRRLTIEGYNVGAKGALGPMVRHNGATMSQQLSFFSERFYYRPALRFCSSACFYKTGRTFISFAAF